MNRAQRFTMMAALLPLLSAALFALCLALGWPVRIDGPAAARTGAAAVGFAGLATVPSLLLLRGKIRSAKRSRTSGAEDGDRLLLRGIADSSRDAIFSFGRQGEIRYANPFAIRLLGLPARPLGYRWFRLLSDESEAKLPRLLDSLGQVGSTTVDIQLQAAEAGGAPRTLSLSLLVMTPKSPRDEHYFSALARDVSDDRALRSKYEETKREAERLSRERVLFLARISHEIRTPLQAIVSVAWQRKRSEGAEARTEWMEQIDISARSLMRTLDDFLDFTKFETGCLALETVGFRLDDTVGRCSRTLQSLLGLKPVRCIVRIDPELPERIIGDPQRVEQVLVNLLSNAARYTDRGEIELTVQKEVNDDDGALVLFSVRDTGIGMTDALLAKLFQPFQQADGAGWDGRAGTGLGLVNAKILAQRMDGSLEADSRLGSGSEFRFRLPLYPMAALPPGVPQLACRAMILSGGESSRPLVAALGSFCHAAASASWERATAAWERSPYHFLILDERSGEARSPEDWRLWKRECDRRNVRLLAVCAASGERALLSLPDEARPVALLTWPADIRTWYRIVEELAPETGPFPAASNEPRRASAARVLLVEDHEISRLVEAQMLNRLGVALTAVDGAPGALRLLEDETLPPFDLIVMDLHMPEMDGLEAVRRIRRLPRARRIPIVMLTADAAADLSTNLSVDGVQDVLLKPIEPEMLRGAIARLLPQAADARETTRTPGAEWLRERPELHVPQALIRLNGKVDLLVRLLRKFRANYADVGSVLRNEIRSGRRREAQRRLHTLRGSAAHLAADAVFEAASRLEQALRLGGRDEAPLLAELEERLGRLIDVIADLEQKYEQSMSNSHK